MDFPVILAALIWLGGGGLLLYRHTDFFAQVRTQMGAYRTIYRVKTTAPVSGTEIVLAAFGTVAVILLATWPLGRLILGFR